MLWLKNDGKTPATMWIWRLRSCPGLNRQLSEPIETKGSNLGKRTQEPVAVPNDGLRRDGAESILKSQDQIGMEI